MAARYSASPRGIWDVDQAMFTVRPSPGAEPEVISRLKKQNIF